MRRGRIGEPSRDKRWRNSTTNETYFQRHATEGLVTQEEHCPKRNKTTASRGSASATCSTAQLKSGPSKHEPTVILILAAEAAARCLLDGQLRPPNSLNSSALGAALAAPGWNYRLPPLLLHKRARASECSGIEILSHHAITLPRDLLTTPLTVTLLVTISRFPTGLTASPKK